MDSLSPPGSGYEKAKVDQYKKQVQPEKPTFALQYANDCPQAASLYDHFLVTSSSLHRHFSATLMALQCRSSSQAAARQVDPTNPFPSCEEAIDEVVLLCSICVGVALMRLIFQLCGMLRLTPKECARCLSIHTRPDIPRPIV